jgi:hypothetical protein
MMEKPMTMETIASVLGWSMVINFSIFLLWVLALKVMPEWTYRTQTFVTSISREDFDKIMYKIMGQYKIALLVTHFGPYIALRILLST